MEITLLTIYFLIWPVIVAAVLVYIARGFVTDLRQARRKGRTLV